MRLFGWFRFPVAPRALSPLRRHKLRHRQSVGWHTPSASVPGIESLETRCLLAVTLSVSNPLPFPEGDSGTSNMVFVVTRSGDLTHDVKVDYTTVNGTAIAGTDYTFTSGTLDFSPGTTTLPVNVPVIGNTTFQQNRQFTLALSNPKEFAGPPSFAANQTFATGTSPTSVTSAHVNGDGLPDLIVTNASSDSVSVLLDTTAPGATTPRFAPQQTFATGTLAPEQVS